MIAHTASGMFLDKEAKARTTYFKTRLLEVLDEIHSAEKKAKIIPTNAPAIEIIIVTHN